MQPSLRQVTKLPMNLSDGDPLAFDKLMALVYSELHKLARYYMRREDAGHRLQTTAWLRLAIGGGGLDETR